ncbi:MAG: SDR family NAD(P)-dependent oxidoreductase [Candidatus Limnocylindrales bacterium]
MASNERVALITGATGELGRALAGLLAADGVRLALAGTDEGRLRDVARGLDLADERWTPVVADMRDAEAARMAVAGVDDRFGGIDMLVHLVGGWTSGGRVTELDREVLRDQLDQHLWATLNVVEAAVPGMIERGWGRVVAVATPTATTPGKGTATYAIPKIAQETLLRTLAREVAGSGVTVNLVVVKAIDVQGERVSDPSPKNAGWATPDEIAAAIAFLCSDAAHAINGARVPLDGRG